MPSPQVQDAAASTRSEADVRAIRARKALLAADLEAEGTSPATIARLATDSTAEKMVAYERATISAITAMFGPKRGEA